MKTLTIDTQTCKTSLARAFTAQPSTALTREQVVEARLVCGRCPSLATCRDFAYVTGMPGFVAGTTSQERADVIAAATAYLTKQRADAKRRGMPFTHAERDRVYQAALRGAHLSRVLAS